MEEKIRKEAKNNYPAGDVWTEEQALIRRLAFINSATWMKDEMEKEQRQELYNETEVLQLLLKFHQTESFDNLKEWFEKNKKCYHPLTERKQLIEFLTKQIEGK